MESHGYIVERQNLLVKLDYWDRELNKFRSPQKLLAIDNEMNSINYRLDHLGVIREAAA